jgi:ribosomal protein S18 acetylase RimI-like enzyme
VNQPPFQPTAVARNETDIHYALEPHLTAAEFIDVLERSTLAARRPVADLTAIEGMLRHASLVVTARFEQRLIGVSRALTDFSFCTYLSDLAVDVSFQRRGIGRHLIQRTHLEAGLNTTLVLLAAPAAREYYPHVGMQQHDSCWIIPRS